MPRLFVLADALHHGSMQAWALGATDTIARPFDAQGILQRIRAAFPDDSAYDETDRGKALNRGVEAAHAVMVKIFEKLPAGVPLKFSDIVAGREQDPQGDQAFLAARMADHGRLPPHRQLSPLPVRHRLCGRVRPASRHARGRPAPAGPRRAAARCRQGVHSGRDPRQAGRAAPTRKWHEIRQHPRRGYDALAAQGGFPPEMLDVVLHHHEFLDGTGYPDGLSGKQISDIVRLTTIVDIYAALVEKRAYRLPFTHVKAFAMMEEMGDKLDQHLLQAFRPIAFGYRCSTSLRSNGAAHPSSLPQLRLRHLLQRRARHLVDETDLARHLEVGQRACGRRPSRCHAGPPARPSTPACGMMNTTGTSSSIGCFFATTAASRTPGTTAITCSISEAATFSPPTFSMSLARSPNLMKPFSSSVTRSPVMK